MNLYNTFSKQKIDFMAEPLMFVDIASRMKSLYSTSSNICIKKREFSHHSHFK